MLIWIWLSIIVGVIVLDQASKLIVEYILRFDVDKSIPIIKGFFHITEVKNTGMAFGLLGGKNERWIFIVASVIGIGALLVYLWKFPPKSKLACASLSMIIGGGIGNMIDRCFRIGEVEIDGVLETRYYVYDFIDFRGIWQYVFNVADSFVCVGAGLLMLWCIISLIADFKKEKKGLVADNADGLVIDESQGAEVDSTEPGDNASAENNENQNEQSELEKED